ncbi:late embryogenesis abundant protein At1g64065-like [Syzygium oleosum]|uniref:late embryogenesis abundant protein At1g64065-like n=1 Tax=Syzygium oleosum TaxID=219896 RepID=UPI0024BB0ABA|nr:late embryogenesis abundant protein At1g64065-like [Syzygium oleosum]
MAEEDPTRPMAPAGPRPRSDDDVELASFAKLQPPPPRRNQRRSSKCFVYALALIVVLCAAFLGFALAVLRVKTPELRLRRVDVKALNYSTTSWPASLSATLVGEAVLRNANFGGFEFSNGTAVSVIYGGVALGGGKIDGGRARARERERTAVKMEVRSSELAADVDGSKNLTGDVGSGTVKLTSYAKMRGRVTVLGWIKRWRTAEMNCTMSLQLPDRIVRDLRCN